MNTKKQREHLKELNTILDEIDIQQVLLDNANGSINGVGGKNWPDLKKDWQKSADRCQEKIDELKVSYRMKLNSIR